MSGLPRGAQEEDLHGRTDLDRFLRQQPGLYPIPPDSCLLSEGVTVFRGPEADGHPAVQPFLVDVVSCAAARHPQLSDGLYRFPHDGRGVRKKIELLLSVIDQSRCTTAILSALGCGAFGHPPTQVALMFRNALRRPWGHLRTVMFCILDDHSTGHQRNPDGNFAPFASILSPAEHRGLVACPAAGSEVAAFGALATPGPGWTAPPPPPADRRPGVGSPSAEAGGGDAWMRLWDPHAGRFWFWHSDTRTATFTEPGLLRRCLGCDALPGAPPPATALPQMGP